MGSERSGRQADFVRVQIDLLRNKVDDLDRLMEATSIRTRRELIDHALTLFEWAVTESQRGRVIGAVEPKGGAFQEVVMPGLLEARRATRKEENRRPPQEGRRARLSDKKNETR